MSRKKVSAFALATLTAGILLSAPREADAMCGCMMGPMPPQKPTPGPGLATSTPLYNDASMVVMMRDGTRTVISMSNNYKGPATDFALVVPVPIVLQKANVNTLSKDVFT